MTFESNGASWRPSVSGSQFPNEKHGSNAQTYMQRGQQEEKENKDTFTFKNKEEGELDIELKDAPLLKLLIDFIKNIFKIVTNFFLNLV